MLFTYLSNLFCVFLGGRVRKRGVYSKLVKKLSDPDSCAEYNIEQFEQILNLVLVDHSLTGCLLALSHKRKNKVSDISVIFYFFVLSNLVHRKFDINGKLVIIECYCS